MKLLYAMVIATTAFGVTKDELEERGWSKVKESLIDLGVGSVKGGLAIYTFLKGDVIGSLYLQAECGVSLSSALTEAKESFRSFKDARAWREERNYEERN